VAKTIEIVAVQLPIVVDTDTASHAPDVGMGSVHAAVDDGDSHRHS
jgi:hypothetical protein